MATLYFSVWEDAGVVALGDPIQESSLVIGASSVQSAESIVGSDRKRKRVRLFADADCFVAWGDNPTALQDGTDGMPMSAGAPEYVDIEGGHKIATIERV